MVIRKSIAFAAILASLHSGFAFEVEQGERKLSYWIRNFRIIKNGATVPKAATPKGMVCMDLKFQDGTVKGSVALPKGLDGVFRWKNVSMPIKSGTNKIDIAGR
jgi:hypothetical protein